MTRRESSLLSIGALLASMAVFAPACSSTNEETPSGPSCTNGVKDENEEGTDCGLGCPTKCTGAGCAGDSECASGKCNPDGKCAAPAGKTCGVGAPVPECADGEKCELDKDCRSGFCDANVCKTPAADSHTDGKKNAGETGIDCGGSVKATAPCPDGQGCIDSSDCVGTCLDTKTCGPIGPKDGKKNNGETDVDCGGPNAPKCANGKACEGNGDCVDDFCPDATKKCTAPKYDDGVKNGTETDVDCGGSGAGMKKCLEGKTCVVDGDCLGACNYLKKCSDAPSCKTEHGGYTCGYGDVGNGQAPSHFGAASAVVAGHESCCRSLPVAGYADPNQPGKTVYVDKYEITAGRMRAFIEAISGMNGGVPKVKNYMATHRPPAAAWNPGWENALPNANVGSTASFTVTDPTVDFLYPGQDQYLANFRTQTTWSVASGNFSYDAGIFYMLGAQHAFVEYVTGPGWPTPDYAAAHALNCFNGNGSFGYSTYWMDQPTVQTYGGGVGKLFTQAQMDEKSLNCTPNAMFAAFCAWDGGQLMTAEVSDYITGNTVEQVYVNSGTNQNGKLAVGRGQCPEPDPANYPGSKIIAYSDGGTPCYSYFYPFINTETYDGSSRIAPPGRIVADQVKVAAGDEPWMDMMGNLQDVVTKRGETRRFDYRGYGNEFGSIVHHKNQQTTPRNKGGAFGARCMRFK